MGDRGSGVEEVQFEPFECDALEIGLHEGDFSVAHPKCPGVIGEVQFALNQEGLEFARVSTIKLIRFMDFGFGNRDKGGIMSGMGKVLDGVCVAPWDPEICLFARSGSSSLESRLLEELPLSELGAPGAWLVGVWKGCSYEQSKHWSDSGVPLEGVMTMELLCYQCAQKQRWRGDVQRILWNLQ